MGEAEKKVINGILTVAIIVVGVYGLVQIGKIVTAIADESPTVVEQQVQGKYIPYSE